jgi:hypothetical protein
MQNKYQRRLPPGSEEALRSYCTCSGDTYTLTNHETGEAEDGYLLDAECPLHGLDIDHELPSNL